MIANQLPDVEFEPELLTLVTRRSALDETHDWLLWAWGVLTAADDVPATFEVDWEEFGGHYADHVITAAALCHLVAQFEDVYTGVNDHTEVMQEITGRARPKITEIELGRYAEARGVWVEDGPEDAFSLSAAAIEFRARTVRGQLADLAGESRLFTSLALATKHLDGLETNRLDAYDAWADEITNAPTFGTMHAFAWLKGEAA